MKKLLTSDLIKYNANPRGTSTGDCTARTISLAFNIDYRKAKQLLNKSAQAHNQEFRREGEWDFNSHKNVVKVIRELGGGEMKDISSEKISVSGFADENPSGTYIIWCSKNGGKNFYQSHLVCLIDGKVYDSWDSRNHIVNGYWTIKGGITSNEISLDLDDTISYFITSKNSDEWSKYLGDVFDNIIDKNRKLKKLANTYGSNLSFSIKYTRITYDSYNFKMPIEVKLDIPASKVSEVYKTSINITFKPTMKADEVAWYFDEQLYQKLYMFVHHVVDQAEDILESQSYLGDKRPSYTLRLDRLSARSFKRLPYWAQSLATYFRVDPPQYDYSDKVTLGMYRPSFDKDYNDPKASSEVNFYAYSVDNLRQGLDEYKRTGDYTKAYNAARDY